MPVSQQKVWLTEQVSLRALLKVTKSVKSHISFGVRVQEISRELLNQAFPSKKVCFRDKKPGLVCDFTDFVTFSNARNDTCFVNQAPDGKTLVNKTGIVTSVAKSDEIGKIAPLTRLFHTKSLV